MELVALKYIAAGLGAGLIVIGAAFGLGKIGAAALEGIARQPEASADVRGAMILIAVLLEGASVIGLAVCMLALFVK